jgi:hypothetical protein
VQLYHFNTKTKSWDAGELIYEEAITEDKDYFFGSDLSLSHDGKTLVVGCPGYGNPVEETGAVFVYKYIVDVVGSCVMTAGPVFGPPRPTKALFGGSLRLAPSGKIMAVGGPDANSQGKPTPHIHTHLEREKERKKKRHASPFSPSPSSSHTHVQTHRWRSVDL